MWTLCGFIYFYQVYVHAYMYVTCDTRDQLQVSFLRSCPLSFALFETVSLISPEVTIRLADQTVSPRDSCVTVLPMLRLQVHATMPGCLKINVVLGKGGGQRVQVFRMG